MFKKKKGKSRSKIVIANWKMKPETESEAKDLLRSVGRKISKINKTKVVICPPAIFLTELIKNYSGKKIIFGLQDVFYEERGSFTGEISVPMAVDSGVKYVIIGHSERRALGETNSVVSKKLKTSLKNNLKAVLCIGERERDEHGDFLAFLAGEIRDSLSGIQKNLVENLIVAYEPIWAIGKKTSDAISDRELEETVIFIKKILTEIYGKTLGFSVPILYGGSVTPKNAESLLSGADIDGFLVGHESLKADNFISILKSF